MNPKDPQNTGNTGNQEGHGQYPDTRTETEEKQTAESYLSFIVSRARKIAAALYLITDTMEKSEPLRQEIRAASIFLISQLSTRTGKSFAERRLLLEQVEEVVEKLFSFLEIGATTQLISEMNAAIMRQQLSLFISQLGDDRTLLSDSAVLPLDFLKDKDNIKDTLESKGHKGQLEKDTEEKGVLSGHSDFYQDLSSHNSKSKTGLGDPKNTLYKEDTKKKINTRIKQNEERRNRREKIVTFIKHKREVTIKDIGRLFKDISEKTIQRELAALVSDGTIKKRGEKRWSKYLIASKKHDTK